MSGFHDQLISAFFAAPSPSRAACHGQCVTVAAMLANKTPRRPVFCLLPKTPFHVEFISRMVRNLQLSFIFFSFLNCLCDMSLLLTAEATKWAEWQKIYIYISGALRSITPSEFFFFCSLLFSLVRCSLALSSKQRHLVQQHFLLGRIYLAPMLINLFLNMLSSLLLNSKKH